MKTKKTKKIFKTSTLEFSTEDLDDDDDDSERLDLLQKQNLINVKTLERNFTIQSLPVKIQVLLRSYALKPVYQNGIKQKQNFVTNIVRYL